MAIGFFNKKISIGVALLAILSLLNCNKKTIFTKNDIVEFYTFTNTTKGFEDYKVRRFIINKFNDYNDSLIKNFTQKLLEKMNLNYRQIDFIFYKHSSITNIEHLLKNPKDLDRYSQNNDMVYILTKYSISPILFLDKFKNGILQ